MFVWFAAASFLLVVLVFSSPALDYRLVMLGAVAPVGDDLLAGEVGTGTPWRVRTRLSDDLSMSALRQTASVGAVVKDIWLIDVASPLIAANVRAAQVR